MKTDPKHFHIQTEVEASLFRIHPEKYAYIFFLYLLLIPFSVFAADNTPFPESDLPDKPQNAAFPHKPDIWQSSIGGGFRDGTQVVGLTTVMAYGILVFGGEERHHLSLISVSYGQMIGDVIGIGKWYRGNWEFRAELFGGIQVNSEACTLVGLAPHLRYNFATGTRLVPYLDVGGGLSLTEIRAPDLGDAFQFNEQAIIGVNYFVKDNLSVNIGMQYLHLSSAAISMPNNGVNTVGCFLGVQWLF
jgi:lipid A 3-O-deacylase